MKTPINSGIFGAASGFVLFFISVFFNIVNAQNTTCSYPENASMSLEILANGNVKFLVTYPASQAYVEVFSTKNSEQIIATNIVSNVIQNANGTYTYFYIANASTYKTGDLIKYRFYAYRAGKPGTFLPGPEENVWSKTVTYQPCAGPVYVSTTGSDSNPGTKNAPVATVFKGLNIAQTNGAKEVLVAEGTYSWDVTPTSGGSLYLVNGISLKGGYSSDFSSRSLDTADLSILTINYIGHPFYFKYWAPAIVHANEITAPTLFEGFEVTGGMSTEDAGGLVITNSNSSLIIRNNNISGNGYQISCPWVCGGNISLNNSSAQLYNNIAINGYKKNNTGNDLIVLSAYSDGSKSDIHHNIFTCNGNTSVSGTALANFHDNSFLYASFTTSASRISVINKEVTLNGSEEEEVLMEVYNLSGQLILKENTQRLSLEGLSTGTYIIAVTKDGERETKLTLVY